MSGPANTTPKAASVEVAPESPTTARPLEMDDDDVQEPALLPAEEATTKPTTSSSTTSPTAPAAAAGTPTSEEAPPPKPPRPANQMQHNEQMLKEAFPTVEPAVVKAVLTASGGNVERAFNALLQMTDPDATQDELQAPPPPPRPATQPVGPTSTNLSQLEADELYARQLAEHYENVGAYEARTANNRGGHYHHHHQRGAGGGGGGGGVPRGRQQTGLTPNELYDDREHSFLDDDLPVIKESLRKGFVETQSKVNTWFTNLKKKIDETFDEDEQQQQQGGAGGSSSFMGRPSRDPTRRSNDYDRYDNDPELLSDDFAGMKFRNDGTPAAQQNRGFGNPNLFKPPPPSKSPKPGDNRRVAFSETVEDIDAYNSSPKMAPKDTSASGGGGAGAGAAGGGGRASKWQPLSAVEPSPIADNDPFSLGDSEDEREDKKDKKEVLPPPSPSSTANKTTTDDDAERLRQATADAMADSLVDDKPKAADKAN